MKQTIQNIKAAFVENHKATKAQSRRTMAFLALFSILAVGVSPEAAMAAPWDTAAKSILDIFTSGLTRTIAIIAMIALGIAALAGKLSWDWAIKVIIGIVLIFGSAAIVDYIIAASS